MPRRNPLTPLRIRPGARYACAGDGLCCSDIHAVGPLSRSERQMLQTVDPRLVVWRSHTRDHVLVHGEGGTCPFLRTDGCIIHNQLGPSAKPVACTRYPLRLTGTPDGGRVSVAHSCSCASVGTRPELTAEAAEPNLRDARGRLEAELRVGDSIPFEGKRNLSFEDYVRWETPLLEKLRQTRRPLAALATQPFIRPRKGSYLRAGRALYAGPEDNRFDVASRWLGRALLAELGERAGPYPDRPWAADFARAEARAAPDDAPARVFGDWLANDLWSLLWVGRTSARGRLRDLASLTRLGLRIARVLQARGVSSAMAAAEAVMVLEVARDAPEWAQLAHALPR